LTRKFSKLNEKKYNSAIKGVVLSESKVDAEIDEIKGIWREQRQAFNEGNAWNAPKMGSER